MTDGTGTAGSLAGIGRALAAEAARFASLGWMRGTSGNLSAVVSRDPLRLAVTASGLDKGMLSADDITVVDSAGRLVPGYPGPPQAAPSAEAALHSRAVALAGASAVIHVHTIAAVVAGRRWPAGVELADLEMLKGIGLPAAGETILLPVIANSQDMNELGSRLERGWNPPVPGVLVADHGLYAWGASLMKARHHTEIIEWILEFMTVVQPR